VTGFLGFNSGDPWSGLAHRVWCLGFIAVVVSVPDPVNSPRRAGVRRACGTPRDRTLRVRLISQQGDGSARPDEQVLVLAADAGQVTKRRLPEDDGQGSRQGLCVDPVERGIQFIEAYPVSPGGLVRQVRGQRRAILKVCEVIDADQCGDRLASPDRSARRCASSATPEALPPEPRMRPEPRPIDLICAAGQHPSRCDRCAHSGDYLRAGGGECRRKAVGRLAAGGARACLRAGQRVCADGVRGCRCDPAAECPRARTYSGQSCRR
jgi:hypothetical protein